MPWQLSFDRSFSLILLRVYCTLDYFAVGRSARQFEVHYNRTIYQPVEYDTMAGVIHGKKARILYILR